MTTFRTMTNRAGIVYNADKTEVLFAEDVNAITGAIVALEENAGGNYDAEIAALESDVATLQSDYITLATGYGGLNTSVTNLQNDKENKSVDVDVASYSPVDLDATKNNHWNLSALAVNLTINNPTGTLVDGKVFTIRIKDNGTARGITFGSKFVALGVTLPTTTVINKKMLLGCIFNAGLDKVEVVSVINEA